MEDPSPSLPPPPPTSLEPRVLAPFIYGIVLQFGMWCIVLTQATSFFAKQGRVFQDSFVFRCFIACLLAAVTAQAGVGLTRLYELVIPVFPHRMLAGVLVDPALNCIVLTIVHTFYVHRCYKLTNSRVILGALSILVLAQAACSLSLLIHACVPTLPKGLEGVIIVSASTLVVDTCISAVLIFSLVKQRTGMRHVDAILVRIIGLTVQSFLPCVFIVALVLIGSTRPSLLGMFNFALPPMGQFYAVAIMSTLNSRASLRREVDGRRGQGGRVSIHEDSNIPVPAPHLPSREHPRSMTLQLEFAGVGPECRSESIETTTASMTDPTVTPMCEVSNNCGRPSITAVGLGLSSSGAPVVTWHGAEKDSHWGVDLESLRDPSRTFSGREGSS